MNASASGHPSKASGHTFTFMLRALRSRNYRLFFCGQLVSLIGTWITTTATSWLVYRLTGSAFLLGIVGFSTQLPAFILLPFAGLVVDRHSKHRLLILTQFFSMLQSILLAFLTLTGKINIPWILGLCAFQGMLNAFDMPCRQAFVVEMIENKKDLGNAIALNSSMFNLARLLGPAIGGLVISSAGEGWCFTMDAVSYLAVLLALLAMKIKPRPQVQTQASFLDHFKEGVKYVLRSKPIYSIIILIALVSLVGVPYTVLMPIFAGPILHGGPHTLGFLMGAIGCGALLAALWLAARKSVRGLAGLIPISASIFGLGLIAFSFCNLLWLSLILLVISGCGFMLQMASSNTILQTIVEDDKRGRVMSLFIMAFMGTAPFGSLLAGFLSARVGAPSTLLISGICCLLGALWFWRELPEIRKHMRPIYIKLGIIPEVASGLQTAAQLSSQQEK